MHELDDASLSAILPGKNMTKSDLKAVKKVALALGAQHYNVLQNNGRLARKEFELILSIL